MSQFATEYLPMSGEMCGWFCSFWDDWAIGISLGCKPVLGFREGNNAWVFLFISVCNQRGKEFQIL